MPKDPSREAHFPAIEKKYGEKMAYWFKVMAKIKDKKAFAALKLFNEINSGYRPDRIEIDECNNIPLTNEN